MAGQFRAESILSGLTTFQRATVDHIIDRFYGPAEANRFLVADETGLGKTMVARGVIARTIEELATDDSVERIDVVYVCSNADLAHQNLGKLNVTGDRTLSFSSRLTMLARYSGRLRPADVNGSRKPVNLIAFTPGTSFEKGWRSGLAEERALIYLLLAREDSLDLARRARHKAAMIALKGSVRTAERFEQTVAWLERDLRGEINETVATAFSRAAQAEGLINRFDTVLEAIGRRRRLPDGLWDEMWRLISDLRSTLARESVTLLEPDLVILDKFQRFRHLLDPENPAGELAHHLFDHGATRLHPERSARPIAKTLLLSATPYKPFTYAEEGEDHHRDFMQVIRWLSRWNRGGDRTVEIERLLEDYRTAVVAGRPIDGLTRALRSALLEVMVRTERPHALVTTMTSEKSDPVGGTTPDALLGYVALRDLARLVDAPMGVEYWKSAPYFANFMDGYKIADRVRTALDDPVAAPGVRAALRNTRRLDLAAIAEHQPLDSDLGNARLQRMAEQTVGRDWWKLLWLPPTLPYYTPGGPYADVSPMTKRLVFSSWTATPTSIASLLSYEAERRAVGTAWDGKPIDERETDRRGRRSRLAYRMDSRDRERPASMAHMALFWPMPGLAELADPRAARRVSGGQLDPGAHLDHITARLGVPEPGDGTVTEASHWFEAFARDDSLPPQLAADANPVAKIVAAMTGHQDEADTDDDVASIALPEALTRHVEAALAARTTEQNRPVTASTLRQVAAIAVYSPANIAYRALQRISHDQPRVTPDGLWIAAASLAAAFRSTFTRPETTLLLDQLTGGEVYWQAVLRYSAWGNLQAVMDEYLHHLAVSHGKPNLDDAALLDLARVAAGAISLRPVRYELFNPDAPESRTTLSARFALRYGGRRQDQESVRQPQVRQAFNSPFWPFVLASTSVGQEGIDFHWWCHAITHWNTPASPIDFEQREGRVDRYDGHAVRLNIAEWHGEEILASADFDPWDAAYRIAGERADATLGAFAPHWVYRGSATIERHISPFALSTDLRRLAQIKKDVALYRLTFGQPRQEDMLELLKQRYAEAGESDLTRLRLDLSAPSG